MNDRYRARHHDQAAIRLAREGRDGGLDLARVADVDRAQFHPHRRRHGLDSAQLADLEGVGRIPEDRSPRHARRDLFEQFQPFRADAVFEHRKTGGIAAGPCQAGDEAVAHGIGHLREHDRHGAGCLQQRRGDRGPGCQNDVRRERDQFRRVFAKAVGIAGGKAVIDRHVTADAPAPFLQPLQERRVAVPHSEGIAYKPLCGEIAVCPRVGRMGSIK